MNKSLGEEIRLARVTQKLTQTDLAKKIGCNQQDIYRYEKGLTTPTGERLDLIAIALGKEWKLK